MFLRLLIAYICEFLLSECIREDGHAGTHWNHNVKAVNLNVGLSVSGKDGARNLVDVQTISSGNAPKSLSNNLAKKKTKFQNGTEPSALITPSSLQGAIDYIKSKFEYARGNLEFLRSCNSIPLYVIYDETGDILVHFYPVETPIDQNAHPIDRQNAPIQSPPSDIIAAFYQLFNQNCQKNNCEIFQQNYTQKNTPNNSPNSDQKKCKTNCQKNCPTSGSDKCSNKCSNKCPENSPAKIKVTQTAKTFPRVRLYYFDPSTCRSHMLRLLEQGRRVQMVEKTLDDYVADIRIKDAYQSVLVPTPSSLGFVTSSYQGFLGTPIYSTDPPLIACGVDCVTKSVSDFVEKFFGNVFGSVFGKFAAEILSQSFGPPFGPSFWQLFNSSAGQSAVQSDPKSFKPKSLNPKSFDPSSHKILLFFDPAQAKRIYRKLWFKSQVEVQVGRKRFWVTILGSKPWFPRLMVAGFEDIVGVVGGGGSFWGSLLELVPVDS